MEYMEHPPERFFTKRLIELGIHSTDFAYAGPWLVAFDLTNICNHNCIGCWCFSPHIQKTHTNNSQKNNSYMPFTMVINTIDELHELGTFSINLSGGGEPMMHPHFRDIFLYLKQKGFEVNLNTNFTLATTDIIDELVNYRLNHLHLSLWAGDAKTYTKVYPNKAEDDFEQLKEHLKYLTSQKYRFPVSLYFVVNSQNYHSIDAFLKFAIETNVETVEFTLIDIPEEDMDWLMPSPDQKAEITSYFKSCQFQGNLLKSVQDGSVQSDKLRVLNLDPFLAKVNEKSTPEEENLKIINKIPCLVGWTYTRIMFDGLVLPCCKGIRHPMGDLYEKSFRNIWFSEKYNEFRNKAKQLSKDSPYFNKINCAKGCDNYINNLETITNLGKDKFRL